jgi:hypothetical protein
MNTAEAVELFSGDLKWRESAHPLSNMQRVVEYCAAELHGTQQVTMTFAFVGTGFSPASEVCLARCLPNVLTVDETQHPRRTMHLVDTAYAKEDASRLQAFKLGVATSVGQGTAVHLHGSVREFTEYLLEHRSIRVDVYGEFNLSVMFTSALNDHTGRQVDFAFKIWEWSMDKRLLASQLTAANPHITSFSSQGHTCPDIFRENVLRDHIHFDEAKLFTSYPVLMHLR